MATHAVVVRNHIEPAAICEVPDGLTPTEFVERQPGERLDSPPSRGIMIDPEPDAPAGTDPDPRPDVVHLHAAFTDFLGGAVDTLLVLGDPGSGKSTFVWEEGHRLTLLNGVEDLVQTPVSLWSDTSSHQRRDPAQAAPQSLPWMPLFIPLKEHSASSLSGLLPRALAQCGLDAGTVAAMRASPQVRLLVLCDGFDELREDEDAGHARRQLHNFAATLCDDRGVHGAPGTRQPEWTIKVVVTSRENRLGGRGDEDRVFGNHARLVLLPFTRTQVCSVPPWLLPHLHTLTPHCGTPCLVSGLVRLRSTLPAA